MQAAKSFAITVSDDDEEAKEEDKEDIRKEDVGVRKGVSTATGSQIVHNAAAGKNRNAPIVLTDEEDHWPSNSIIISDDEP